MRNTLHVLAAADVRWMLELLAVRGLGKQTARHRELQIDAKVLARARTLFERALAGGRALTRPELYAVLARGKIAPDGQRGIHILGTLAMQRVLCFGAPRGKQQTFVLFDEWVAPAPVRDRDDALGEVARRYMTSHGPASAADLAWWAGITLGDARRGLDIARGDLKVEDGLWRGHDGGARPARAKGSVLLLPPYDEYTVAYRDRSAILDPALAAATRNGIFSPVVVVDGRIAGTWRRTTTARAVTIAVELTGRAPRGLAAEVVRYGTFVGKPATLATR
jgi:hypothetical protein